jgi:hypothetical protein
LYGNGESFEKILKNKICSQIFDLNEVYVNRDALGSKGLCDKSKGFCDIPYKNNPKGP